MTRAIDFIEDNTTYPGNGLGISKRHPIDQEIDAAIEDAFPLAKRGVAWRPEEVVPEDVGGTMVVKRARNLLRPTGAAQDLLMRNQGAAASAYPVVGTFANGAPCLDVPSSGTTAQPLVSDVQLNPAAHSLFGVARLTLDNQGSIIDQFTAFTGKGVRLIKVGSTNKLRLTYDTTQANFDTTGTYKNKCFWYLISRGPTNGVRFYVDGSLVFSDAAATAPATALSFQYFSSGTGAGLQTAKFGPQWLIQDDITTNASLMTLLGTKFAERYALGS